MDLTFEKVCEPSALTAAIIAAGLTQGDRFFGVTTETTPPTVVIHLPDDATQQEQNTVTTTLNNLDALPGLKSARSEVLREACQDYILVHYNRDQQSSLNALLTEAVIMGYPTRIQYVGQALAWIKGVINYYYTKKDAISAATTPAELDAVTWDFPGSFDSYDPDVTLRTASNLNS